jgi:hypothetical protein
MIALTPSERHAAARCRRLDASPACATCGDDGTVLVGVGPVDRLSGQPDGTVEAPCPACSAGDDAAVERVRVPVPVTAEDFAVTKRVENFDKFLGEIDALSRAALAPAPAAAPRRKEPSS